MRSLKVFYSPSQSVSDNDSFSPSAGKPALVLESWRALGLDLDVEAPRPLTRSQIALAHDPGYVRGVLSLTLTNGFGNRLPSVAASLRYTTGSIVAAARYAAKTGLPAASLTSGFHHAGYDHGGGFCTFNGLMIAVQALRLAGLAQKVGIIDIDHHYGDGTEDIIRRLGLQDVVRHYTFGRDSVRRGKAAKQWLKRLPKIVREFSDCDVIIYQAGADPHIDDPLGGALTSEQLRKRDQIVFGVCREIGVPVCFNLAGGYQTPIRKVLDVHDSTAIECLKIFGDEIALAS